jgi:type II secretory pathway component GspD/PulD (secretin)
MTVGGIGGSPGGFGSLIDDLQVRFLIRATQAHKDSRSLTAPKVSVLSGESATMRVQRTIRYALQPDITTRDTEGGAGFSSRSSMLQNYGEIPTGTILNITPTITPDKKHVLLNIVTELRDFLGYETTEIEVPNIAGVEGVAAEPLRYSVKLPQTEISRIQTRVTVPDGGTLLLGGQKVTEQVEKEVGVPILSKLPIIGRLFSSRSKVKDHKILLILVKPTIILQEEKDAEALASSI